MVKGLYTATLGMKPLMKKQDIISNNLANANTTAFKKSDLFVRTYLEHINNDTDDPFLNDEMAIDEVEIDFTSGPITITENPFDLAIEGKGFFNVKDSSGETVYTKTGSFNKSADGFLITKQGNRVLDETGNSISIDGKNFNVLSDGYIEIDGRITNKLKLTNFESPHNFRKLGDGNYGTTAKSVEIKNEKNYIRQGFLEGSNVSPVNQMVQMLSTFRNYESNQKAIHAIDETLNKAVNEVGRIR